MWENSFYVFGGAQNKFQISQLVHNHLGIIGWLPFSFELGACSLMGDEDIMLCFDRNKSKSCWASKNPLGPFENIPDSNFDHQATRTSSSESEL